MLRQFILTAWVRFKPVFAKQASDIASRLPQALRHQGHDHVRPAAGRCLDDPAGRAGAIIPITTTHESVAVPLEAMNRPVLTLASHSRSLELECEARFISSAVVHEVACDLGPCRRDLAHSRAFANVPPRQLSFGRWDFDQVLFLVDFARNRTRVGSLRSALLWLKMPNVAPIRTLPLGWGATSEARLAQARGCRRKYSHHPRCADKQWWHGLAALTGVAKIPGSCGWRPISLTDRSGRRPALDIGALEACRSGSLPDSAADDSWSPTSPLRSPTREGRESMERYTEYLAVRRRTIPRFIFALTHAVCADSGRACARIAFLPAPLCDAQPTAVTHAHRGVSSRICPARLGHDGSPALLVGVGQHWRLRAGQRQSPAPVSRGGRTSIHTRAKNGPVTILRQIGLGFNKLVPDRGSPPQILPASELCRSRWREETNNGRSHSRQVEVHTLGL